MPMPTFPPRRGLLLGLLALLAAATLLGTQALPAAADRQCRAVGPNAGGCTNLGSTGGSGNVDTTGAGTGGPGNSDTTDEHHAGTTAGGSGNVDAGAGNTADTNPGGTGTAETTTGNDTGNHTATEGPAAPVPPCEAPPTGDVQCGPPAPPQPAAPVVAAPPLAVVALPNTGAGPAVRRARPLDLLVSGGLLAALGLTVVARRRLVP